MAGGLSMALDFAAFEREFRLVGPILEAAALPIMQGTGEAIVAVAKEMAPDLSGELRDSIKVQGVGIDKRGPYVDVGTTEPYALYQEFGTEHNPAHPFMRPAIAKVTGEKEIPTKVNLAPRHRTKGG